MFPTSTLPVSPFLGSTGLGTLIAVVGIGALVALLVGLVAHRRELRRTAAIELGESGAAGVEAAKSRLSA